MAIWKRPYRWMWRTTYPNIRSMFYDILWGFKNVARWVPVIWFDSECDHSFLITVLEKKFAWMEEHFRVNGVCVNHEKQARKLKICSVLCGRINADKYLEVAAKSYTYGSRAWAREADAVQRQDLEMLTKIMKKNLYGWWD